MIANYSNMCVYLKRIKMKYSIVTNLAVAALTFCGVTSASTPATKSAAVRSETASAPLPEVVIRAARVSRAVEGYVNAMSRRDGRTLPTFFTDDAVVEFVSDNSGVSLAVRADSLLDEVAPGAVDPLAHVANVRVFPTRDASAVFVQYDVVVNADDRPDQTSSRLALVEMRGERIDKLVDFSAPAASLAHGSGSMARRDVVVTRR